MKALVTGGAGFIGSHVVRALLAAGHEVRVLHLPTERLDNLAGLPIELLPGDVTDRASVRRAVRGRDWVFHLAALYALWLPRPQLMMEVNVTGTRNVLEAARDVAVAKVVHTSSIARYGGQGLDTDATERSPFRLGSTGDPYCQSKYESHELVQWFANDGLDVTIVAPCGPVGPGDIGPTPTGRLLLGAVNLPALAFTPTVSNMVDVRAVAQGHLLAAERGKRGEAYLLGETNLSLRELANMAQQVAGQRKPLIEAPIALAHLAGHVATWYAEHIGRSAPLFTHQAVAISRLGLRADCTKAWAELGLPRMPIRTAVRDALVWFARHGYVRDHRTRRHLLSLPVAP